MLKWINPEFIQPFKPCDIFMKVYSAKHCMELDRSFENNNVTMQQLQLCNS